MEKTQKISRALHWSDGVRFFKELFLIYVFTGLLGHFLEMAWAAYKYLINGGHFYGPINTTFLPIAPPYGFGAVAVIIFTLPLIKKYKLHPIWVFIFNSLLTGFIEYICAAIIVFYAGHNIFWDYSNQPFNINGYVCLESALAFGFYSTLFIYFVYPFCIKLINKLKSQQFDALFWTLFIGHLVDLLHFKSWRL